MMRWTVLPPPRLVAWWLPLLVLCLYSCDEATALLDVTLPKFVFELLVRDAEEGFDTTIFYRRLREETELHLSDELGPLWEGGGSLEGVVLGLGLEHLHNSNNQVMVDKLYSGGIDEMIEDEGDDGETTNGGVGGDTQKYLAIFDGQAYVNYTLSSPMQNMTMNSETTGAAVSGAGASAIPPLRVPTMEEMTEWLNTALTNDGYWKLLNAFAKDGMLSRIDRVLRIEIGTPQNSVPWEPSSGRNNSANSANSNGKDPLGMVMIALICVVAGLGFCLSAGVLFMVIRHGRRLQHQRRRPFLPDVVGNNTSSTYCATEKADDSFDDEFVNHHHGGGESSSVKSISSTSALSSSSMKKTISDSGRSSSNSPRKKKRSNHHHKHSSSSSSYMMPLPEKDGVLFDSSSSSSSLASIAMYNLPAPICPDSSALQNLDAIEEVDEQSSSSSLGSPTVSLLRKAAASAAPVVISTSTTGSYEPMDSFDEEQSQPQYPPMSPAAHSAGRSVGGFSSPRRDTASVAVPVAAPSIASPLRPIRSPPKLRSLD